MKWSVTRSVMSYCEQPHGLYSPRHSPGQNTGVGGLSLLQGIFPTQGLIPGLPHCGWILYQLSHKGSPRILEWIAYPFSSRSSPPRNQTGVSCIAGGLFTNWVTRERWRAHSRCLINAFLLFFPLLVPFLTNGNNCRNLFLSSCHRIKSKTFRLGPHT